MTTSERIAKIRELLNGIDTQKLFTLAKWFDVRDDNKGVPVEMREVQHDLNKYAIMATEALSLLDCIETEGAIERAMKEHPNIFIADDKDGGSVGWDDEKKKFVCYEELDDDVIGYKVQTVLESDDLSTALAALLGEEPTNEA